MVIETSALVAILLSEPAGERLLMEVAKGGRVLISSVSLLEASLVLVSRRGEMVRQEITLFLKEAGVEVVAFDFEQAEAAYLGWLHFGEGRHPAGLNFGDCCSYGLAKVTREPLLFKGEDFRLTDIEAVV